MTRLDWFCVVAMFMLAGSVLVSFPQAKIFAPPPVEIE